MAAQEPRRVVVTGLGLLTPVGLEVAESWSNLLNGVSGIGPISHFDTSDHSVKIAGEVTGFDPIAALGGKEARRLDRCAQLAYVAADQALEWAHLDIKSGQAMDAERAGVFVGSGIGGVRSLEDQAEILRTRGPRRVSPFMIPMLISNLISGGISIRHGIRGPTMCHVSACATGNHAIGEAFRTLKWGYADAIVCGGSEAAVTPLTVAGFANMKALSTSNERGSAACRPFDRLRDGFIIAEGAGCLVLEALDHARNRGAPILAELRGYGATSDAHHITAPAEGGEGIVRAMRHALEEACLEPQAIGYINAHGTSTPYNDRNETLAYKTVFGAHARNLAISSTKSMTGHLLGGAGAVEAIFSVLALRDGAIPPTVNYEEPDPECDLDYVPNVMREKKLRHVMSNAMGFGGQNASLVFSSFEGS